jgi:cellobiose phosphorylase
MKAKILMLAATSFVSACTSTQIVTEHKYPPVPVESVQVLYQEPQRPYETIAFMHRLSGIEQRRGDRAMELWDLINPVYHATTAEEANHYKVEPYVVCADVYGAPPHTGRGGWTWYTGSASWLYRVAIETILGFRLRGGTLRFEPCVPPRWPGFELSYRHRSATYRILVDNSTGKGRGVKSVELDGQPMSDGNVPLGDDGKTHNVRVRLG